jgi:hypothetical protein
LFDSKREAEKKNIQFIYYYVVKINSTNYFFRTNVFFFLFFGQVFYLLYLRHIYLKSANLIFKRKMWTFRYKKDNVGNDNVFVWWFHWVRCWCVILWINLLLFLCASKLFLLKMSGSSLDCFKYFCVKYYYQQQL